MEDLLKFLTGGHLVYLRPCLLTVHLVTALEERINPEADGNWTNYQSESDP